MEEIVNNWRKNANNKLQENRDFFRNINHSFDWDTRSSGLHKEVFNKVDCLACANCCKTTPALIDRSDVKRIALHLGLPPKIFVKKYLLEDVNGEMIINKVPCTFLQQDNTCAIYEVRPKACREYPHTDQKGFSKRGRLNVNNTLVCPATYEIVERLKNIEISSK